MLITKSIKLSANWLIMKTRNTLRAKNTIQKQLHTNWRQDRTSLAEITIKCVCPPPPPPPQVSTSQTWSWCSPIVFSIILATQMRQRRGSASRRSSTQSSSDSVCWRAAKPLPPNVPVIEPIATRDLRRPLSCVPIGPGTGSVLHVEAAIVFPLMDWHRFEMHSGWLLRNLWPL